MHVLNKAAARVCPRDRARWRTPAASKRLKTSPELCVFETWWLKKARRERRPHPISIYALSVSVPASPIHFYALFKSWFAFYISSSIVSFYRGNSAERPAQPVPQWDSPLSLSLLAGRRRQPWWCSFALSLASRENTSSISSAYYTARDVY